MIEVGVKDLRNELSRYLRRVARGERVRITSRGKPVADLLPAGSQDPDADLRRLAAEGRVTLATKPKPRRAPRRERSAGKLASEYILEDRAAER